MANIRGTILGTVAGLVTGDRVYIGITSPQTQTLSMMGVGTWDSATATFQISADNTNWFNATDSSGNPIRLSADGIAILLTSNVAGSFNFARIVIASGAGAENITLTITAGAEG